MHDVIIDHGDSKGSAEKWSATEKFFDAPNSTANRVYRPDKFGEERSEHNWDNYPEVLSMLKRWGKGFIADGLHQYFFPITKYYRKWANILKRLVLRDDLQSDKQRSIGFDRLPMPFPVPYAYPTNRNVEFKHHNDAAAYLHSLLLNRGLFSGFAARDFFRELIKTQLVAARFKAYKNYEAPDGDMSFKEFYNITGVDLVLTGVNISRHEPRYFSVWHTPDFPVVEAVALSMSIPFAFKPVYIEGGVRKGDQAQNLAYQGLYVDGGMLNNYPVRAFDTIALRSSLSNGELLRYRNEEISGGAFLAIDPKEGTGGNEPFLGFRLVDLGLPNAEFDNDSSIPASTDFDSIFPKSGDKGIIGKLLGDLYFTFMYSSSAGQIRYVNDRSRTVPLNTHGLELFDFAHQKADKENNKTIIVQTDGKEKEFPRDKWKEDRIKEAQQRVLSRVEP